MILLKKMKSIFLIYWVLIDQKTEAEKHHAL